jgi:hypothetical protein
MSRLEREIETMQEQLDRVLDASWALAHHAVGGAERLVRSAVQDISGVARELGTLAEAMARRISDELRAPGE